MKRKRGAQPGNRNALKHGFYSPALTPQEISLVWNAVNLKGIDPAIAVIRIKLALALERDPANRRLLEDTAKLITKKFLAEHPMGAFDARQFRAAVLSALEVSHESSSALTTRQNEAGQAQIALRGKSSLSSLKPRRKTDRDCQSRMSKQDQLNVL